MVLLVIESEQTGLMLRPSAFVILDDRSLPQRQILSGLPTGRVSEDETLTE